MGVGASYSRRALGRWRQLTCPPGGRRAERELSPLSLSRASSTTSWKSSTGSTPIAVIGVPSPRAPAAACLAADVVNRCRGWEADVGAASLHNMERLDSNPEGRRRAAEDDWCSGRWLLAV